VRQARRRHRATALASVLEGRVVALSRVLVAWLVGALLCVLMVGPAQAQQDYVVERAVLTDPSGALTLSEALAGTYQPIQGIFSAGYTSAVHWLRIKVLPATDGGPVVLRIRPTFLDTIVLYAPDPNTPGGWHTQITGDTVAYASRDVQSVSLAFAIEPEPSGSVYYLRLTTTSSTIIDVAAIDAESADLADFHTALIHVAFLTVMIWILAWGAHELMASREAVIGFFVLSQISSIAYCVGIWGYLAPLFPDWDNTSALTNVLVLLMAVAPLCFHRSLIAQFRPAKVALFACDLLIGLDMLAMAGLLLGYTRGALELNAMIVLLAAPMFLGVAFTAAADALPGRVTLRVVYGLQAAALLATMAPYLGLVSATQWNLYGMVMHGMLSALPMFYLLHLRSTQIRKQGIRAGMELMLTRQQLEMERRQSDIQSQFLAMLTHELKTPLAVARLALDTIRPQGEPRRLVYTALDNMNDIIERCSYADQIDQGRLEPRMEPCELNAMVRQVAERCCDNERLDLHLGQLPPLTADRLLVEILLGNLVDNALKYSPAGTRVSVTTSKADGGAGLVVDIENQPGRAGLPDAERVFEKFYRSRGAQSKSGSGLGLYIVRGIAQLHGGNVTYQAVAGKARFSLSLPC